MTYLLKRLQQTRGLQPVACGPRVTLATFLCGPSHDLGRIRTIRIGENRIKERQERRSGKMREGTEKAEVENNEEGKRGGGEDKEE